MNASSHTDWRPNWTESEIVSTVPKIAQALRAGPFRQKIKSFSEQSHGSTWWSRQFDITQRMGYSSLDTTNKTIQSIANDAPRVLRRIKTQWGTYIARVRMQRDQPQREEIIRYAQQGPTDLYFFLVTDHIHKAWLRHSPGMEASIESAWNKIGYDNQFLWSLKEFDSTFF